MPLPTEATRRTVDGRQEWTGTGLFSATIDALSTRAPAVVAAAAAELGEVGLGLHFGDGTQATLRRRRSRLLVDRELSGSLDVELYFDSRAMNLLFDLARRPVEETIEGSLDIRGERSCVLAVWRTFRLLSHRASGLRAVQELWRTYRDQAPHLWGVVPEPLDRNGPAPTATPSPRLTGWRALDFLDERLPSPHTGGQDGGHALSVPTVLTATRSLWDGHVSNGWWRTEQVWDGDLMEVMSRCRDRVAAEMDTLIPDRQPRGDLYHLMRAYPSRQGKGLRPTLTVASCGAFGGRPDDAVRVAAALELFHNGFLVHDDIADESTHRRGKPTLHERHGVGLAVNTGDGLNLLAVDAVLSNLSSLGLARTLGLIHEIMHMCRETVEGQAIELGWIARRYIPRGDRAYFHMSTKKTGWYTCISPCRLGAVSAGVTEPSQLDALNEALRWIGIAFQIQDDALNLLGEEALYGKEPLGDLLEGKRTVMLIHLMRSVSARERPEMERLVLLPRAEKTQADAQTILAAMEHHGSIDYALDVADRLAHRGAKRFELDLKFVDENESKGVLRQVANYVTTRPL